MTTLAHPAHAHTPLNTTSDPQHPPSTSILQRHTPVPTQRRTHCCPGTIAHPRAAMHHRTQPCGHLDSPSLHATQHPQSPPCCHGSHTTTGTHPAMHSQRQGYNAPCLSLPIVAAGPTVRPPRELFEDTWTLWTRASHCHGHHVHTPALPVTPSVPTHPHCCHSPSPCAPTPCHHH